MNKLRRAQKETERKHLCHTRNLLQWMEIFEVHIFQHPNRSYRGLPAPDWQLPFVAFLAVPNLQSVSNEDEQQLKPNADLSSFVLPQRWEA